MSQNQKIILTIRLILKRGVMSCKHQPAVWKVPPESPAPRELHPADLSDEAFSRSS
ncbi:S-protein 18, partial [Clarias magur]